MPLLNSNKLLLKRYFFVLNDEFPINNKHSFNSILLGVSQGSELGPLFFIIFINDLEMLFKEILAKLFADDTTLIDTLSNMETLISKFKKKNLISHTMV